MIEEIHIRDLGVITDARLPLQPGLSVLTGETGAGKTMVVTALGMLLGAEATPLVCAAALRVPSQRLWCAFPIAIRPLLSRRMLVGR